MDALPRLSRSAWSISEIDSGRVRIGRRIEAPQPEAITNATIATPTHPR
jgi:hypothetical protein